ncbi:MAG: hypothetical protein ACRENS_00390 [Candidatus Eiseniibacteriota bacterium]
MKWTRWALMSALLFATLAAVSAVAFGSVKPKSTTASQPKSTTASQPKQAATSQPQPASSGQAAPSASKVENPHGKFKGDCGQCHGANGWKPAKISPSFNHAAFGFPLTGAHSAAKCMACHSSLDFSQGKQLCASCHQDPHRGEMGTDCARCHSARSFVDRSAMVRQHQSTRFPLTGSHAQIDCEGCHKPTAQGQMQFVGTKAECQNCHMDNYKSTTNPNHVQSGFPLDCASCHSTLTWSTKTFDHDKTAFPLTGAHRTTACQSCHGDGVYKGKTTDCYGCHKGDYDGTNNPVHSSAGFPTGCISCHNTTSWGASGGTGGAFNHNTMTTFALNGAHTSVACAGCHGDGVYKGKSTACYSCHQTDYNGTTDPKHSSASATFVQACQGCHTTAAWTGATFNHSTATTFPLTGAHVALDCNQCHGDNLYKGKSTLCYSCHQTDYAGTTTPAHQSAGFPTNCETCHSTANWTSSTFNHNTSTTFPLTGAHVAVACSGCHGDNVYKGKSTDCYSCHQTDYTGATPNHQSSGFGTNCTTCHTTTVWSGAVFDHSKTLFPLTGAHAAVACNQCHGDNVYQGKSTDCYSCHKTDYSTATPNHQSSGFGTNCLTCHNTTTFAGAVFDHSKTAFPLTGAHAAVACNQCHGDNVYQGKSTLCYSCHQADYTGTTNPKHSAASSTFVTACESCHGTTVWTTSSFNHTSATTFPLTGAHIGLDCNACHGDNIYKGKSTLCYTCHQGDYNGTTTPAHKTAGFPTNCETCHSTTNWTSSTFNHNTSTTFPLTGAHQAVACNGCHGDNVYKGKSTLCYSCHKSDYDGTTDPKHGAAASTFVTTCESCHNTTTWTTATFNHTTATTFPLTGAHITVDCNGCHGDNVYKGKSTLCYSCHQTDYNTTVVNHTGAGFGTACETCHTTTAWSGGKYTAHDTVFPVYSGKHLGKWSACTDCHSSTTNYAIFACYGSCHSISGTDGKHGGVNGYVKGAGDSNKCYSCHPKGHS